MPILPKLPTCYKKVTYIYNLLGLDSYYVELLIYEGKSPGLLPW